MTPDAYDAGREHLLAKDRRRRRGRGGALGDMLPTSNQLVHGRDWPTVLALAELDPPKRVPSRPAGAVTVGATSHIEAQVWFVRCNGRYASRNTLTRFMADCNAALEDWPHVQPYGGSCDLVDACLREERIVVPAERPRADRRGAGTYALPPEAIIPGAPASRAARDAGQTDAERRADMRAGCVEALLQFSAWMAAEHPRMRPSRARYLTWRRGTTWPAPRTFDQFGGFSALLIEASS